MKYFIESKELVDKYVNKKINSVEELLNELVITKEERTVLEKRNLNIKLELQNIEYPLMESIEKEVDSNNKKLYSNDQKRKIELEKRLNNNNNFQELNKEFEENDNKMHDYDLKITIIFAIIKTLQGCDCNK